ncbi:DUF2625 family protein [Desmospora activa]|uniref:Uncharacterized protein DUF2625 n=1 Tax=Desmospora activa DSM 45169 TaxID=1121389 RepID=A0A2T4Z0M6_9BACL|nr:DUF2625 family protein [Desmospora activa]PTM53239.1 uncharacterized protein DUF2625 [Desmospora activa DSM 45169]
MKPLSELIVDSSDTKQLLQQWKEESERTVQFLPENTDANKPVLHYLQVTTHSILGHIAYHTGGIIIDHGWLRILGSGHDRMQRDVQTWNVIDPEQKQNRWPGLLLVADDVLGGFFALNGGGVSGTVGKIVYLAPDTLEWEALDLTYPQFIDWAMTGDIKKFYQPFYWTGWEQDVQSLHGDQGYSFYPFLWTREGKNIESVSRKAVPIAELWKLQLHWRKEFNIK